MLNLAAAAWEEIGRYEDRVPDTRTGIHDDAGARLMSPDDTGRVGNDGAGRRWDAMRSSRILVAGQDEHDGQGERSKSLSLQVELPSSRKVLAF